MTTRVRESLESLLLEHWPMNKHAGPEDPKWLEGYGICSCGAAKADGVTPYKFIWRDHIMAVLDRAALLVEMDKAPEPAPWKMLGTDALGNGNEHFGEHERNNFCEQRGCKALDPAVDKGEPAPQPSDGEGNDGMS